MSRYCCTQAQNSVLYFEGVQIKEINCVNLAIQETFGGQSQVIQSDAKLAFYPLFSDFVLHAKLTHREHTDVNAVNIFSVLLSDQK